MKIGIVSMHRVKNNGSFLQAYALYQKLKEKGHEVSFVDFIDPIHQDVIAKKTPILKAVLKRCKSIVNRNYRKQLETNKCREEFNNKYTSYLTHIGLTKDLNLAKNCEFDLLVIGSDEVFNICQFTDKKIDIPWELFGDKIKAKAIITYAASCGQTDYEKIKSLHLDDRCKDLLSNFSDVSVRDQNTFNFITELSDKAPVYNIDPVLWLNEFPKDNEYKKLNFKYVLIYAYTMRMTGEKEKKAIIQYAKKNGLKTVCVNCYQPWCDVKITASPFALLQYVKDAERVVTDTFHGTVFSIRNNTPFVTIIRESNKNKLRFLLKQFSLSDREVSSLDLLEQTLERKIDFKKVNELLEKERKYSDEYIAKYVR